MLAFHIEDKTWTFLLSKLSSVISLFSCKEAMVVGGVKVDGRDARDVESAEEMVGRFQGELMTLLPKWKKQLIESPRELESLERDVHSTFARGADLLVAGLVAVVMKEASFQERAKEARGKYCIPLARGCNRTQRVRLLGGLVIWIASLYCAPRKNRFGRGDENVPGLHIELVPFGFAKGCSPALESLVARQAALCPSLELAQRELERHGVKMDVKTVRRISRQCGLGLLTSRRGDLQRWREGTLPAGTELAGKRVSVQIDGGRTKIRGKLRAGSPTGSATGRDDQHVEDIPGRSKKRPKRTFDADWREPKLATIFIHDEHGRMVKHSQATVDGTFLGPDALAELVAMHLHRLGAARAKSITFAADGAPWIWDRLPVIVEQAHLEEVPIYEVLDCSHAVHHISLALSALGLSEKERRPLYREHRSHVRNGRWRRVVEELEGLAEDDPENEKVRTEIAYLRKHGEAGHLKYTYFRSLGLPIGSGAIESSIRRVINLRLKGNGIFWRVENAEAMLQIRAQVITDRWDERLQQMREHLASDGRRDWTWDPQPMSVKVERKSTNVT